MLEKIIESWLTKINERQYQLPFCQLLSAEGEQVIYISSHNPYEKGKDVVTLTSDGAIRAYQLKAGDLNLSEWRAIAGEIDDLVRLPVTHPSIPEKRWHSPFLVTNGEISEPVLEAIRAANDSWEMRNLPKLIVISKGELVSRFRAAHGSFVPKEINDLNRLLKLFLAVGEDPLQKESLFELLKETLQLDNSQLSATAMKQSVASATLMLSYVLLPHQRAGNHWAEFEGWVILAASILSCATKFAVSRKSFDYSLALCRLGINSSLGRLFDECALRPNLVEGDPLTDGFFYGYRVTILNGLFSALALSRRISGDRVDEHRILNFVGKHLRRGRAWGESAAPYYMMTALFIENASARLDGENLMGSLLGAIAVANRTDGTGFPNPYISVDQAVRSAAGIPPVSTEQFVGFSYSIAVVIEYLARRWRKQLLKQIWPSITRISLLETRPSEDWAWFLWSTSLATLDNRLTPEPQSWQHLLETAEHRDTGVLPPLMRENSWLLPYFLLVFPHRLTVATQMQLEAAISTS